MTCEEVLTWDLYYDDYPEDNLIMEFMRELTKKNED